MGYAEWIAVKIHVSSSIGTVGIRNAQLSWGKFYAYPDKNREISKEDISQINVSAGLVVTIAACGRENATSGTEGSFDCYDGNTMMGTFWWDDPYKAGATNQWGFKPASSQYIGGTQGGASKGPEIGEVTLSLTKF